MPEGPSVVILKEAVQQFKKRKIISVIGNSKISQERLLNRKITDFKSWGKHFLICFREFNVRIHFLMWGSYTVNETKDRPPRLGLKFKNGEINFYSCSIKIIEGDLNRIYDFTADVMSDIWDPSKAKEKLYANPERQVCDALMEQDVFAGVGNIIKNEVLYRIHVHPESLIKGIPDNKINELIDEARNYSFDFLRWKKKFELRKHWLAHRQKICGRCNIPFMRKQTGTKSRRSFYCANCQVLY